MAVTAVLGGRLAWVADNDPAAARVLAHHHPDVPNLGDITAMTADDWTAVEAVDIVAAGFPCQDLSYAGRGAGITEGTRSGLWFVIARAVGILRPRLLFLENVAGIVARRPGLDVVLADLAALGFDAVWCCVRASDVGAPHRRDRWFCVAWPAGHPYRVARPPAGALDGTAGRNHRQGDTTRARDGKGRDPNPRGPDLNEAVALLPTPRATDGTKGGPNQRGSSGDLMLPSAVQHLLPTPRATDTGTPGRRASEGFRPPLSEVLLPTPNATDGAGRRTRAAGDQDAPRHDAVGRVLDWGPYGPAIDRWAGILGRPAPAPTEPAPRGGQRLSPAFVEWMMGLPAGHVTAVPGLSRNAQLRLLGNGVVWRQGAHALRSLLAALTEGAVA